MYRPGWPEPMPTLVSAWMDDWSLSRYSASAASSSVWETTSARMIYVPVVIPRVVKVKAMWWVNGTSSNENMEAGIYRDTGGFQPGAKVASTGLASQGYSNELDSWALSGGTVALAPGTYWLALGAGSLAESSDVQFYRVSGSSSQEAFYKFYEAASPGSWPTTATPLEATNSSAWLFGIVTTEYPL